MYVRFYLKHLCTAYRERWTFQILVLQRNFYFRRVVCQRCGWTGAPNSAKAWQEASDPFPQVRHRITTATRSEDYRYVTCRSSLCIDSRHCEHSHLDHATFLRTGPVTNVVTCGIAIPPGLVEHGVTNVSTPSRITD